jgi:hypothetical protein
VAGSSRVFDLHPSIFFPASIVFNEDVANFLSPNEGSGANAKRKKRYREMHEAVPNDNC